MTNAVQIGINARLFPNNWRPVLDEIVFSHRHGFESIQFPGRAEGLNETHLGAPLSDVAEALAASGMTPVMEILIRLNPDGKTPDGLSPLDTLNANLPAITGLK